MYQYYQYIDIGTNTDITIGTYLFVHVCLREYVCVCDHTWTVAMLLRNTNVQCDSLIVKNLYLELP